MRVDDGDDPALRWLVRNHVRGGQTVQESREPRVHGVERAELLEQILGGPVARISEPMPLDLAAQAGRAAGEPVKRIAQQPQAFQQGHEPVALARENAEIEVPGHLASSTSRYFRTPVGPEDVLHGVAGRWAS